MSKALTEQWRERTLPEGYYYIRWIFNIDDEPSYMIDFYDRENFVGGAFINKQPKFIDEVMCAVPSFPDLCELKQELEICKEEKADLYAKLCNALMQLEEANKVIKWYDGLENILIGWEICTGQPKGTAKKYLERYGVK